MSIPTKMKGAQNTGQMRVDWLITVHMNAKAKYFLNIIALNSKINGC